MMEPGEKFLLAQIDPFSPECFGAKIPDSNTVPSVAIHDVENFSLTLTVPTNQRMFAFNPTYTSSVVESVEGAAGWAWVAAFGGTVNRQKRGSYIAAMELGRPCAHALRISSPVARSLLQASFILRSHMKVTRASPDGRGLQPFRTCLDINTTSV